MAAPRSAGRRSAPSPCRRRAPRPRRTRSLGRTIRQLRPSLRTCSRICRIRGRCFRKPTVAVARQRSARYPKSAKAEAPPGGFVLGRQGPRGEVGVGILSPGADAAAAVRTRRRSTRGIIRHFREAQCPGRARAGPRKRATEHCSASGIMQAISPTWAWRRSGCSPVRADPSPSRSRSTGRNDAPAFPA